ncbi:MAG: exosortase A, partial [Sphingobium sp.]
MTSLSLSSRLPITALAPLWRRHLTALGAAACAIVLIFAHDVRDLVRIWWTSSTFEHCLFIPLLIGWLVHQRMPGLRRLVPALWWPGLVWVLAGNVLWLLGDAAGVALLRHGALVMMGQGAVIALLGPTIARALLFPLFYAIFMVPFGEEVVPPLQLLTAKIAMQLLEWSGVPAHIEGIFITIPNGYFEVAEACSGAKFLIAMVAYAVLVGHVCFRSWLRRVLFLVGAVTLSIAANGVRAFATIYVAHRTSVDAAVGFDHVMYGWLFFGLVMALAMAAAWPFFDRDPRAQWMYAGPVRRSRAVDMRYFMAAMLLVLLVAPMWSMLSSARAASLPTQLALPQVAGWE